MTEHPTFGDFILGFEGLAIVRSWGLRPEVVRARAESVAEVVGRRGERPWSAHLSSASMGCRRLWPVGPGIRPAGQPGRDGRGAGREGDRGRLPNRSGTGCRLWHGKMGGLPRIAWSLGDGNRRNPEMLAEARQKVPEANFEPADLGAIPLGADSVELAVCALALTHVAELAPAVQELARVVRPGGRVVISDVHPFMAMLGNHARYPRPAGSSASCGNHVHQLSEYLSAFRQAGLTVLQCREPLWGDAELATLGFARRASGASGRGGQGVANRRRLGAGGGLVVGAAGGGGAVWGASVGEGVDAAGAVLAEHACAFARGSAGCNDVVEDGDGGSLEGRSAIAEGPGHVLAALGRAEPDLAGGGTDAVEAAGGGWPTRRSKRTSAWLKPRERRRRACSGMGKMTSGESSSTTGWSASAMSVARSRIPLNLRPCTTPRAGPVISTAARAPSRSRQPKQSGNGPRRRDARRSVHSGPVRSRGGAAWSRLRRGCGRRQRSRRSAAGRAGRGRG